MATVYIKSDTGSTGSGTRSDPYYFDELDDADTAAGASGTVVFLDGTYTCTTQWSATDRTVAYKADNKHKAILSFAGNNYFKYCNLTDFKIHGHTAHKSYVTYAASPTEATKMVNCLVYYDCTHGKTAITSKLEWEGCTFYFGKNTQLGFQGAFATDSYVKNCTFYYSANDYTSSTYNQDGEVFDQFAATGGLFYGAGVTLAWENNIIYIPSNDTLNGADSEWTYSTLPAIKNSCFFDASGNRPAASLNGYENGEEGVLFVDPKFIDAPIGNPTTVNKNLGLRPNSPLIGAGIL